MSKRAGDCTLCRSQAYWEPFSRESVSIDCACCGRYFIATAAQREIESHEELHLGLSAAAREASDRLMPITFDVDNYVGFAEAHRWTSVPEKARKILKFLHAKSSFFSQVVSISPGVDYPLFDAVSPQECQALLHTLRRDGLIAEEREGNPTSWCLTMPGWEAIEPLRRGGIPGRCFVAMAFDESLDDAYYKAIKPAVIAAGYEPVCMKERFTNENICDVILAEIRKAQFVVADFTQQKGGVYFEAGFAKALGKEVFWSCQMDDFKNLHFDTNHFGHIKWTTPEDLKRQLGDRIIAELGIGPHKQHGG